MPGVTREQIDRAKEWDLLSYLQTYERENLLKSAPPRIRSTGQRPMTALLSVTEDGTGRRGGALAARRRWTI